MVDQCDVHFKNEIKLLLFASIVKSFIWILGVISSTYGGQFDTSLQTLLVLEFLFLLRRSAASLEYRSSPIIIYG